MALAVKAISIVQGSRDFNIKAISVLLLGPTPNNTPPLITPGASGGGGAIIGSNIIVKPVKKPA